MVTEFGNSILREVYIGDRREIFNGYFIVQITFPKIILFLNKQSFGVKILQQFS